jgi:UDP-glucuronate 4-epimerase
MKIVVTGAAGFIGSHLVEALLNQGHQVIGIDNFNDYYSPSIKCHNVEHIRATGGELVELDLATDDLKPYVKDANVVYHSAAQSGISRAVTFQPYVHNNLLATHKLLEALQDEPSLRLFVYVSTSSVYGATAVAAEDSVPTPISYYGVTKLAAEQLVMSYQRQRDFPACSLRLFSVYGARERPDKLYPRLIHSIVDGVPFPLYANSWNHKRSFTFVGDVVGAFVKALDTQACVGEIINIGSTDSIATGEAVEIVQDLLGAKANYILKPPRLGDQIQTQARVEKAKAILGYYPTTPFLEGIKHEIEWFLSLPMSVRSCYSPDM